LPDDISDHALEALRGSKVREVVISARRGPAQSAFTLPELIGADSTCEWCSIRRPRSGVARPGVDVDP